MNRCFRLRNSFRSGVLAAATALVMAASSGAHALVIEKTYTATNGSGKLTFTDLEPQNALQIAIDNTSSDTTFSGGYENSSLITGLIFNVTGNISTLGTITFTDGNGTNLANKWEVVLGIDSNISPGNTVFDVTFRTTNGVKGGIYNAANPGTNLDNAFPDIAILTLNINSPVNWALTSVDGTSWLRMQRVGPNGAGSLKIPDSDSGLPPEEIPEPGALLLMGAGLLGLGMARRRKSA